MEETCKQIETKAKKLEDTEKLESNSRYKATGLLIQELDKELASKEKTHIQMSGAIGKLSLEIASEEKTLERARFFNQQLSELQHKEEERLKWTRKNIEKCTAEYLQKKDELLSVEDSLGQCIRDLDIKEREFKSLESLLTEISDQVVEGNKSRVRLNNSNDQLSRTIKVIYEELCSINKAIRECSAESEIKRNDLVQVKSSITHLTDELSSKELELESVKKKLTDRLKVFGCMNEQKISLEASLFKCDKDYEEKLAKCEKEFELKEKELAALVERIDDKEQQLKSMEQKLAKCEKYYKEKLAYNNSNDSRSEFVHELLASSSQEGALKDLDGSNSFSPNEVLIGLLSNLDPGRYVLDLFSEQLMGARQRREKSLGEHMLKVFIPIFEELPRVVRPIEHLHAEARKLAEQWSLMVGNTSKMSPFEAWGFLQFIVAYGLLDPTKQNEALQFACNVAHFRQAPKLFQSLGLLHAIPSVVHLLINQRKIIPAIRFTLHFKLSSPLSSPLDFLKEEIISLRSSASRFESHVRRLRDIMEERNTGRLRDIIEIIEDFKLDFDLHVDLIVKFMVPRKAQNQNHFVVISSVPCHFPTIFGLELSRATESTAGQAQYSHQSGHTCPMGYPPVPSSVSRRCS